MGRMKDIIDRFVFLAAMLVAWVGSCFALEISDLAMPLNRDKADDTLSKDYMYKVLGDGSIRRTWQLSDKTVFVDFAADTGDVLLIAVEYKKPVSRSVGIKDAHAIAGDKLDQDAKWLPPKSEDARKMVQETFGLENPMRKKLKDDAVLFYETDRTKKRISRISLFAVMPSTNRWVLSTLTPESRRSAMGLQITSEEIANLYKDEQRRMAIPLAAKSKETPSETPSPGKADTSTGQASATTAPTTSPTAVASTPTTSSSTGIDRRVTAMGVAPGARTSSSNYSPARTETTEVHAGSEGFSANEFLGDPPDWLQSIGIEHPEWWHYFAFGLGLLTVLLTLMSSIASSARRAKQRATFEKIMASHRAGAGKKRPRIRKQ